MMGGLCQTPDCGEIVADASLCSTCTGALRVALRKTAEWVAGEVDVTTTRQARTSRPTGGGRPAETPLPFSAAASEAAYVLRSALAGWVRILIDDDGTDWPADTTADMARWLLDRTEHIRHHPAAEEALDEISSAVDGAERAVDIPDPGALLGVCPTCQTPLYGRQGDREARCHVDGCDGWVDGDQWHTDALRAVEGRLMGATDIARTLTALGHPLTPARIHQWASRGHLEPAGHGPTGQYARAHHDPSGTPGSRRPDRPLYRVADVRALLTRAGQDD